MGVAESSISCALYYFYRLGIYQFHVAGQSKAYQVDDNTSQFRLYLGAQMTTITVDILKCQMGLEDLETFLLEVGYPVIDLPSKVSKNSSSLVS